MLFTAVRWPRFCVCVVLVIVWSLLRDPEDGWAAARPASGTGVLVLHNIIGDTTPEEPIPLFDEPGLRRVAEVLPSRLPTLAQVLSLDEEGIAVAVVQKKADWARIAYDDAGREGWVKIRRKWQFISWDSWLKGRGVRLLPGIKKQFTLLHPMPTDQSAAIDLPLQQKQMRVIQIKSDWIQVLVDVTVVGWLRWRDDEGRFLVQVTNKFNQQKR
jgi:hypothetical protein